MRQTILAALAAAAPLAGCGGGDDTSTTGAVRPTTAAGATADTIRIENFLYAPDPVTVKADRRIRIVNVDSAPHTVTEQGASPSFDSDTIKGGASGSVTFSAPGTYAYFCQFHPTMKGSVTVTR